MQIEAPSARDPAPEPPVAGGAMPRTDTAFVTVSSDSVTQTIPVSEIDTTQKENGCKPLYFYGDGGVFFTNKISIDSEGKNDMNVQLSGIIFLK